VSAAPAPHLLRRALLETRAVLRLADEAYAPFSCPASGECCQLSATGRPPWLFRPEWLLLEAHLREAGRALPPPRADGGCPLLDDAGTRCTVYADRPLGCRTFFCHRRTGPGAEPTEQMSRLTRRLEAAAAWLSPDEDPAASAPRPLPAWMDEARR
jgi:Fe-S-cluster containining protein